MIGRQGAAQIAEQLGQLLREVVGRGLAAIALEREHREPVRAGGAPEAEVDPSRIEAAQGAEGLRHLERAVVRQHDPAASHPDALGGGRDRSNQHFGGRAREPRRAVMLGDPEARVSELVGQAREVEGVVESVGARGALGDGRLVEDAQTRREAHVRTDSGTGASAGARCGGRRSGISSALASALTPANIPPSTNARSKPFVRATCADVWPRRFEVRLVATVASIARPSEPPICRDVLIRPEARPTSLGRTPAIPATVTDTKVIPIPAPAMMNGTSTSLA